MSTINITNPTIETKKYGLEGGELTLSVVASSSVDNGVLTYQWEKKNKRTGLFVPMVGEVRSDLIISGLTSEDENDYRCVVTNTYTSIVSMAESLVRSSNGSESVLVDDEYNLGYRSFSLRTRPSTIYDLSIEPDSVDIVDITAGQIESLKIINPGDEYDEDEYLSEPLTGGSGSGATANIIVSTINLQTSLISSGKNYPDTYVRVVTNISNAALAVVTSPNHGFSVTDKVIFRRVTTMTEINEAVGEITAVTTNTFTVNIPSTSYTPFGVSKAYVEKVIWEELHVDNSYEEDKYGVIKALGTYNVPLMTNGSGSGLRADLLISGAQLRKISILENGSGYAEGDFLLLEKKLQNISRDSEAVITCEKHGLSTGDKIYIYDVDAPFKKINSTERAGDGNAAFYTIQDVPDDDTFVIDYDTSDSSEDEFPSDYVSGGYVSVLGYSSTLTGIDGVLEVKKTPYTGVVSIEIDDPGEGYELDDELSATLSGGSGFNVKVSSINTTVVVDDLPESISEGDTVGIYEVSGMTEINELFGRITTINSNSLILAINSSGFSSYTSGGKIKHQVTKTIFSGTQNPIYLFTKVN